MITRTITGNVIRPNGTPLARGRVVATPILPVPADGTMGIIVPRAEEYAIINGQIFGTIVAPCTYEFQIYDENALIWRFTRAVADVASVVTLESLYIDGASLPTAPPNVLVEGASLVLLGSAGAAMGNVATADGVGGIFWSSAGSGDMIRATYDTNADGRIDTAAGGTGANSSAWSGVPRVIGGEWSVGATAADVGAIPREAKIVSTSVSRAITIDDAGAIIECDGTVTITAPAGFPVGFQVAIVNVGAGSVTLAAPTLQSADGKTTISTQYAAATMYHRGGDVWLAVGALT